MHFENERQVVLHLLTYRVTPTGELEKFATLSPQRFPEGVDCTAGGLQVSVHGAKGEVVTVVAIGGSHPEAKVRAMTVDVGATGIKLLSFP
jgi:hypothetical protein